ncbi:hypothetical protein CC80DRAFT_553160 [Byssothecium circinans]|uniref:Uncharacterized protein n=1 Tax=Byssothecium circinans TaxID=147558 RepID=A0A6A5TF95_9PLEO|nr:hypothetical protein CC80DRAFT_553160 [Byssothecium circinans]
MVITGPYTHAYTVAPTVPNGSEPSRTPTYTIAPLIVLIRSLYKPDPDGSQTVHYCSTPFNTVVMPRAASYTAGGVAASDVVLTGPRNWDEWYNVFKGRAISAGVWKYLDPEDNNKPALKPPADLSASATTASQTLWKERNKRYHINQEKVDSLAEKLLNTVYS